MSSAVLRVEDVAKSYGGVKVLEGIDFAVRESEVVCFIGPSGGGKSTLLRCINHLEVVDGGGIYLDDELIGYEPKRGRLHVLSDRQVALQRRRIGMVFQSFDLFEHMTVLQNVSFGPQRLLGVPAKQARHDAMSLLDRVGLADKASSYPAQLSGGQQQRTAIARSLAMGPRLLLMDEPTSALDPELVAEVLDVIRDLAESGTTMVVVTHEIEFAMKVADNLGFLDRGNLIEYGPPQSLLAEGTDERCLRFLSGYRA